MSYSTVTGAIPFKTITTLGGVYIPQITERKTRNTEPESIKAHPAKRNPMPSA